MDVLDDLLRNEATF
jgi:hypothetical protein